MMAGKSNRVMQYNVSNIQINSRGFGINEFYSLLLALLASQPLI